LIAIAGVASFRGVECLKKRAGEYKDEIIAQGVADAEFVSRVTENAGKIARTVDSVALATVARCY
jgi:hypothetical protein